MSTQTLEILEANSKQLVQAFLDFPYALYRGEPNWHPPLRFERKDQLSQKKNPIAAGLDRQLFIAKRGDKVVGRIAGFINKSHQDRYQDGAGHFGYFDCEANPETGTALLSTVETFLKSKKAVKMIGPSSHSTNEESGLLIDGFDTPPVLMMPYGRPDYQGMFESYGLKKAIDLLAYQADLNAGYPRPKMTQSMVAHAKSNPSITFRSMDKSRFRDEVDLAMEIFNDAWSENWGYLPFTNDEINHMAKEMKPLIHADGFRVGMIDGDPAAFIWMIPNLNEAIRDLDGKLFPFGWAKLITRLKVTGVKTARIPLMGIRKKYQTKRVGLAVIASLCEDVFETGRARGYTHCELSWILETNKSMRKICEQASAIPYKTYRMYEKNI